MNKLSYPPLILVAASCQSPAGPSVRVEGELKQWHKVTLLLEGSESSEMAEENPFLDYRVSFRKGKDIAVLVQKIAALHYALNHSEPRITIRLMRSCFFPTFFISFINQSFLTILPVLKKNELKLVGIPRTFIS